MEEISLLEFRLQHMQQHPWLYIISILAMILFLVGKEILSRRAKP